MKRDLIILDLILPDGNGLLHLDCLEDLTDAPILIATGSRRKDDAEVGSRLGAAGFIAKPYSVDDLEARMEAALPPA